MDQSNLTRLGWILYAMACGALLYACLDQIAGGQIRLAWISGTLLIFAAIAVWNTARHSHSK